MNKTKKFLNKHVDMLVLLLATVISITATTYYFLNHLTLIYNDARSHLDIARMVLDNQTPGITQLGGTWLPIPHILMMPLIWNETLWHTGLAGSIISMLAYILSSFLVFKTIQLLTNRKSVAFIGFLIFALNPNMLYIQSTPLTEPLLICTLMIASYFFLRWSIKKDTGDLLVSSLGVFFATLIRYEGWFMLFVCIGLIIFDSLVITKRWREGEGQALLYATLGTLGIVLWMIYNLVIWGNPIYFLDGPYSASAQQNVIAAAGGLPTKHNIILSLTRMVSAISLNSGIILTALAAIAILFIVFRKTRNKVYLYALIVLAAPSILDFVTLVLGITTITTSKLHMFNIRYGLMALPLIAVVVALLINTIPRRLVPIAGIAAALLCYFGASTVTIYDGQYGSSGYTAQEMNYQNAFTRMYKGGDILASVSTFNPIMQGIGVPFKNYTQEGNYHIWDKVVKQPQLTANYVMMVNNPGSTDLVYKDSYLKHKDIYNKYYTLVYEDRGFAIYAKKSLDIKSEVSLAQ